MRQFSEQINNTIKVGFTYDSPEFPLYAVNTETKWNITHIPHWHNEIEIIYQLKGYTLFSVSHKVVKLCEGQAIIINTRELHSESSRGDYNSEYWRINFDSSMLLYANTSDSSIRNFVDPLLKKQLRMPCLIEGGLQWEKEVIMHIRSMINFYTAKPAGFEYLIRTSIFNIFSQLIMNNALKKATKKNDFLETDKTKQLNTAFTFIHNNYHKGITERDVAMELGMSPNYFSRFFRFMVGKTSTEYINRYRIDKAAELISTETKRISDIAMETGFDSLGHFNETFKEYKKCTPSEYRRLRGVSRRQSLPQGWSSMDIGYDVKPGWCDYGDGIYTIGGSGYDMYWGNDEFHFAYTETPCNFAIMARVLSIASPNPSSKAGLMVRKSLSDDSSFISIVTTPRKEIHCEWRTFPRESPNRVSIANIELPVYIKIERTENNFKTYYSPEGSSWVQLGDTIPVDTEEVVYSGLAVSSLDVRKTCIASIASMSII